MPRGIGRAVFGQLVAPRRDAGDAMPGAALDAVLQRPLLAHGGGVQRQRARLGAGTKRGHAAIPCTAITAFMRATARSGSLSRRSEEHTSELQSLMRISYAVFCLKKKKKTTPRKPESK